MTEPKHLARSHQAKPTVVRLKNATYGAATPVYLALNGSPVIVEQLAGGMTQIRTLIGVVQVYDPVDAVLSAMGMEE